MPLRSAALLHLAALALSLCCGPAATCAQPPVPGPAPRHFGVFFWHASPNDELALAGIRSALKIDGRHHRFTIVRAHSDRKIAAKVLGKLRRDRVDLVFAMGTEAALLAKRHVTDRPVVFTAVTNPVESRVVPDWRGSRCNLSGNSNWIAPATVLEGFRRGVPHLRHLGVLRSDSSGLVSAAEVRALRRHVEGRKAGSPPCHISEQKIADPEDIPDAVDRLVRDGAEAIWIPIDLDVYQHAAQIAAAARIHRVPLVSTSVRAVPDAACVAVLPDYDLLGQRAAVLALKILDDGVQPASIPIGTLQAYRIVVDLTAARRCGYQLPLSALVLADQILGEHPPAPIESKPDARSK